MERTAMIGRLADWIVAMAGGEVSPTAHRMGMAFVRFARIDLGGELRPSVSALCKIAKVSERHAHRALKELREGGWIKVVGMHAETRCNIYVLTIPVTGETRHHDTTRHHGGSRSHEGGGSRQEGGGESGDPNTEAENAEVNTEDPHVADAPCESDESDPFEAIPADVLATLAEAQAPVNLPPSAPSRSGDSPQVPPPPLTPATHPTPVATVTQPALPALSAPAVATDTPAVERKQASKPRKSKPGVEGAEDHARGVMDAWDAAWANAFRRTWQRCAEGCDSVGKSRCATHFPGYAWAKRDVFQVRAALKTGGWTADRLVRLMPYYHRQLDGKDIPRTIGGFLRAASTIEARNPAPRIVPAPTPAPAPAPVAPLTPAEPYNPLRDQSIPRGERLRMLGITNPWGPRVSGDVQ